MIYGIDFDGTIVEEKFPEIGKPNTVVVDFIRDLQARGDKWVLITMREGKHLDDAVAWLKSHGLTPDAVNDNLPERIEKWGNNPRKIYADIYIDDHNAGGIHLPGYSKSNLARCEYCGKPYRKKKKAQRFCSIKCKDKWWNRERAADFTYLHPHCEDNFNGEC